VYHAQWPHCVGDWVLFLLEFLILYFVLKVFLSIWGRMVMFKIILLSFFVLMCMNYLVSGYDSDLNNYDSKWSLNMPINNENKCSNSAGCHFGSSPMNMWSFEKYWRMPTHSPLSCYWFPAIKIQCFGSRFIESRSGSRVLMTNNWKVFTAKQKTWFF